MQKLSIHTESWLLREPFRISRHEALTAEAVVVEIMRNGVVGRGECERPEAFEPHYPNTVAMIEAAREAIEAGADRQALLTIMPPGAARSAVDCALWDLEAKLTGMPAWRIAGRAGPPAPVHSLFTISLDTPEAMAESAARQAHRRLLKLKLGGAGDIARVEAVRRAAPDASITVDANEAWTPEMFVEYLPQMARLGVKLVEQPLPRGADAIVGTIPHAVPVCADESCHDRATLPQVAGRYDYINVKIDKTGGLTEALALCREARKLGLRIMIGSMVGTSLAMAPCFIFAEKADYIDLDGPLLLARDRPEGLRTEGSILYPPMPELWG